MYIFLGTRIEGMIEQDSRISKFNFRLRKFYSIKETILEKRMINENS